jgi:putative peptidoglycan lipid II flippase
VLFRSLLGSTFGASSELDAFNAASRVTETLYLLIAGGALGSAFIPTFTSYLARGERQMAWRVGSAVTNLVFLVTLVASIVTALIAPWLVSTVLAPGFSPGTRQLAVVLLRWMVASTVIFGVSGLLMGVLNASGHFLLPALAPSMYNLGIIGGVALCTRFWGIHSAAIGTLAGALLHLLIQLPALRKLDWAYSPTLGLYLHGVRQVGRLMGPRVLGMAITQLNFWVNTNLGSHILAEGVVSALTFGWMLMLLPQRIFAQAIATVLFPSFSAQAARQERGALRTTLFSALQVIFYVTFPATIGLILLRKQVVEMLLMRGEFGSRDVAMAASALAWYAVGLVAHSELEIVTRAFYALHDTVTPVWSVEAPWP